MRVMQIVAQAFLFTLLLVCRWAGIISAWIVLGIVSLMMITPLTLMWLSGYSFKITVKNRPIYLRWFTTYPRGTDGQAAPSLF